MGQTSPVPANSNFRAFDTTTTLRPAHMRCPACNSKSNPIYILEPTQSDNIDFFHCGNCGGAWFHEKDMDAALRATGASQWPAPKAKPEASAPVLPAEWSCPCCGGRLVTIHDRRGSGATVRRCLVCYGGWMEYADLVHASEAYKDMLERLGKAVRGLWTR
ncbi:MAG TPA: zf-TFIIB domain-containing protein [Planctomycetota bacterium]|jgi:Zn-finger nucleic acid-binding protein